MKKTLLTLLLALCMLVSFATFTAFAEETEAVPEGTAETATHTDHCVCGGAPVGAAAQHSCETLTWQPLPEGTVDFGTLASGNYYLTGDVQVTEDTNITKSISICLNGHNITTTITRVFGSPRSGVTLNICDCSYDAQAGTWGGTITGKDYTGTSKTYGSILYTHANSVTNIWGGNYIGGDSRQSGGVFVVANDGYTAAGATDYTDPGIEAVMNIYNGYIHGATTKDVGGTINLFHSAVLNVYGGTITGGTATTSGGNIYGPGSTAVNIYGGTISGGTCTRAGGNVYAKNLVMSGGTVKDGTAGGLNSSGKASTAYGGGNIFIPTGGTGVIKGGAISGGTNTNSGGGNILVYADKNTTLTITGGTITGGTSASGYAGANIRLTGNTSVLNLGETGKTGPTIQDGNCGNSGGNIYSTGTVNMYSGTVKGGTANLHGGNIWCEYSLNISGGTISGGVANGRGGNVHTKNFNMSGGTITEGEAKGLNDSKKDSAYGGGNVFINSGATAQISGGTISKGVSGTGGANIQITANSTTPSTLAITGGTITDAASYKTYSGGNIRVSSSYCTVTIGAVGTDGPTISNGNAPSAYGGNIYTYGPVTMYSGTISGGTASLGGNVYSQGDFTVQGGTIEAGKATNYGGNIYQSNDPNDVLTITGDAVIKDGHARSATTGTADNDYLSGDYGGNIYVLGESDGDVGNLVISGGTISGGYANCGGNIYCGGIMEISGGIITGGNTRGDSGAGGNIYVSATRNTTTMELYANVTMTGGTIEDGYSVSSGGNVQCHGNFTMTGGQMNGGSGTTAGNLRVFRPGNFVLDGGTISGGRVRNLGAGTGGNTIEIAGSAYDPEATYSSYATFTLKSGTVIGANSNATNGGCIMVNGFGILNIEGGTIDGGYAKYREYNSKDYFGRGGSIYIQSGYEDRPATVNISGGVIKNGEAESYGGLLFVGNSTATAFGPMELNITGGTFQSGKAKYGGILATDGPCTVNITGGTFQGGEASVNGGLFWLSGGADVNVSGGTFTGCTAEGLGDGIYVVDADLTISGDVKLDCTGTELYVENTAETANVVFATITETNIVADAADKTAAFASSETDCAAKLVCADEAYGVTWETGKLYFKEYVATVGKQKYMSLQAAVDASADSFVKLIADSDQSATVNSVLYLDLNGHSITGTVTVAEGAHLYGMDSATDDYNCTDGEGNNNYGTVKVDGNVAMHHKTTAAQVGSIKRYLTYTESEGVYSFHRIYLGVTSVSIRPGVKGVGYKATFRADEKALSLLAENNAFGYKLWVSTAADEQVGNTATRGMKKADFDNEGTVSLRLQNFDVANFGEHKINASVYMTLADGTTIESSSYNYTLRSMIEKIDGNVDGFSEAQMEALQDMLSDCAETLTAAGWAISNIMSWSAPAAQ